MIEPIHNRMPVILASGDDDRWLEPGDLQPQPIELLKPYPAERIMAWRVAKDVENVRNDNPAYALNLRWDMMSLTREAGKAAGGARAHSLYKTTLDS